VGRPAVVVQVRFGVWTAEGRLRHAAFVGVRPDKEAGEVRRE
jgi:bifunctional non-homologous end joining protein LigD